MQMRLEPVGMFFFFFFFFSVVYINYLVINYAYRILHNDNDNSAREHRKGPKRCRQQHVWRGPNDVPRTRDTDASRVPVCFLFAIFISSTNDLSDTEKLHKIQLQWWVREQKGGDDGTRDKKWQEQAHDEPRVFFFSQFLLILLMDIYILLWWCCWYQHYHKPQPGFFNSTGTNSPSALLPPSTTTPSEPQTARNTHEMGLWMSEHCGDNEERLKTYRLEPLVQLFQVLSAQWATKQPQIYLLYVH